MNAKNIAELSWARIADAQHFVSASRSTFYNWLDSGLIRSRRINGARFIDMDSLRQLMENAPQKPTPAMRRKMKRRAEKSADSRLLAKHERKQAAKAERNGG
jgi:hypothetical protein